MMPGSSICSGLAFPSLHSLPIRRAALLHITHKQPARSMATVKESVPHIVRTAHERRQSGVWNATLSRIEQVNSTTRLLRLSLPKEGPFLKHLPGQYIDLSIPSIPTVGGFTITSPPQTCLPHSAPPPSCTYFPTEPSAYPYIELAIQKSPSNPPAAYLWRPSHEILRSKMDFRVGGNFTFPPVTLTKQEREDLDTVIFIAGGVGINPVMSMLSAMDWNGFSEIGGRKKIRVLYGSKREVVDGVPGKILFEERLEAIARRWDRYVEGVDFTVEFLETGDGAREDDPEADLNRVVRIWKGRITHQDLADALGRETEGGNGVIYVCGPPIMTDDFVQESKNAPGMDERRVLCEKWW